MNTYTNLIFVLEQTIFNQKLAQKNAIKKSYEQLIGKWTPTLTEKYKELANTFKLMGQNEQENILITSFLNDQANCHQVFEEKLAQEKRLVKGRIDFLKTVIGKVDLIAYSKHPKSINQKKISENNLEAYFSKIYFSDDFTSNELTDKTLDAILEKEQLDPDETLIVGANLHDEIAAANQAKLPSLWLSPKKDKTPITPHPTLKLSRLSDLLFYLNVE